MDLGTSDSTYPGSGNWPIPIDLFGSKKHAGVPRGVLAFADASGDIVFTVSRHPSNTQLKLLLDSSGNTIFSIKYHHNGSWKCYKGESCGVNDVVFRVQRTVKTRTGVELEVFFYGERSKGEGCDLIVRGSPSQRSCSIYEDSVSVAQASLMYKLHQIYVSRGKFRLTIFSGTVDQALIVALFVIFLNGRK